MRHASTLDQLINTFDRSLRTLSPGATRASQSSPATSLPETQELNAEESKHVAGLMRINHTGEVCAQGLYMGQALTARDENVKASMQVSAQEEEDHLAWCEERLKELDAKTSLLNPLFFGMSLGIGTLAGIIGDKWSLGFIAATEDQVCKHLNDHLEQLPAQDQRSREIIKKMIEDEEQHGRKALDQGGAAFSESTKKLMSTMSKVMTKTTYYI